MRITIVQGAFLPVPPLMGGAVEKVWFALGKEFARQGHDVTHISCRHPDLLNEEVTEGVQHIRAPGFEAPSSLLKLKAYDLLYSLRVLRALPPADILVTNTFWLPILAQNRQKYVGQLCVHVARAPRGQMKFYRKAARLNTVSTPIAQAISDEFPALQEQVRVIAYPLPYAALHNDVPLPIHSFISSAEPYILYVGRIHPEKGIGLLLEAFARLTKNGSAANSCRLRVVGPYLEAQGGGGSAYQESLRAKARELKIEPWVDWVGPVFDDNKLGNIYRQASVFAYPSLAEKGETFGLAPLEAMAFGCPPVVSALPCFRDFVEEGINGSIFDHRAPDPAQALADALYALLHHPELQQVRANGLATAQHFTVPRIAKEHLTDFCVILNTDLGNAPTAIAEARPAGETAA